MQDIVAGLQILATLIGSLWSFTFILHGLKRLQVWQQKEYRPDRMRAYYQTYEGRELRKSWPRQARLAYLAAVFIAFAVMWLINSVMPVAVASQAFYYYFVILILLSLAMLGIWIFESVAGFRAIRTRTVSRPRLSAKIAIAISLVIAIPVIYGLGPLYLFYPQGLLFKDWGQLVWLKDVLSFIYFPGLYLYLFFDFHVGYVFGLVVLDLVQPFLIAGMFQMLQIFSWLHKKTIVIQARRKIRVSQAKIIGITGSYGKSSTKELIADLLAERYAVLRTPANNNTIIGVARTAARLTGKEEYLVAEMGAYRKGEIKEICAVVPPDISVVTAVNEQHLALFGETIADTVRAKYEIIEGLIQAPDSGREKYAVINADDAALADMISWAASHKQIRMITYSAKNRLQVKGKSTDLLAVGLKETVSGISFRLISSGGSEPPAKSLAEEGVALELPVCAYQLQTILAAVAVCLQYGYTLEALADNLKSRTWHKGLPASTGARGARILDDQYSSNPDGFTVALDQLQKTPGKRKIVVTKGMIELGSASTEAHRRIGEEIASTADILFLLSKNSEQPLREGIGSISKVKRQKSKLSPSSRLRRTSKTQDYYMPSCRVMVETDSS
ncbi:MAG TPA: UDP-N-acetylmuramoyl-tripeptide--D-alanyl-D-alanine ligase, partial [bacterium]|nr:UDP-N-acetylmuramoyl-tripeptide--D-alanyl-D-alanine ligase [bacterium]